VLRFALLAIVAGAAACNGQAFACAGDGDCVLAGEPGVCVDGNCAYPDDGCASGLRYPAGLGGALAGQCVPSDGATDTDAGTSNGPSTSTSSGASDVTASSGDATSSGTTEAIDPTTAGVESTGSPSSTGVDTSSTGGAASSSTAADLECTDLACGDCMRCVDAEGQACAEQAAECSMLDGCYEIAACMETCVAMGDCATNCCEDAAPGVAVAAVELHACRLEVCGMLCRSLDPACM
jgi:hypothetical protein